jgi:hypothetical protein
MNIKLSLLKKYFTTMLFFIFENIYLITASIIKFYYISTYKKYNSLLIINYITAITQINTFICRKILFVYNYFHDNDLTKNINNIIYIYILLQFINFIIINSLSIANIIEIYDENLYKITIIDIGFAFLLLLIRFFIYMLYEYDFI